MAKMKKIRKGQLPHARLILTALGECGLAASFIPQGMSAYKAYYHVNHEEHFMWFLEELNLDLTLDFEALEHYRMTCYMGLNPKVHRLTPKHLVWIDKFICAYLRRHIPWKTVKEALLTDSRIVKLIREINSGHWTEENLPSIKN